MAYSIKNRRIIPEIGHIVYFIDTFDGRLWTLPVSDFKHSFAYFCGEDAEKMKESYWSSTFKNQDIHVYCGNPLNDSNIFKGDVSVSLGPISDRLIVFFDKEPAKNYAKNRAESIKNEIKNYLNRIENYNNIVKSI